MIVTNTTSPECRVRGTLAELLSTMAAVNDGVPPSGVPARELWGSANLVWPIPGDSGEGELHIVISSEGTEVGS